ncbi:pantoate--beta-alanine ligase [Euzebya tangerina]|uniref:pantoate--beta-alanine ligase n=1 Tax=Euzebya tangerina TaxID=591198 RepID=UPI000E30DB25|nr:pantoate--beta-alanine ligase [Euzebya tangerina]
MGRPQVITGVEEIRRIVTDHRSAGRRVGLVPTMGALHDGHLSLVDAARRDNDVVVTSIFVNPLQFAPGEDLEAYPRNLESDVDQLAERDVELVFHPDVEAFTSPSAMTTVHVDGLSRGLEAVTRPTHFDGVTTIVTKLLNTVAPDAVYFGAKDFQQQAIIRQMVGDLNIPVEVVTCPIVREPDGLAMSSRNVYLSAEERVDALALSAALIHAHQVWDAGEHDADELRSELVDILTDAPGVRLDYAEVIDPVTLEPLKGIQTGPVQVVLAAFVGPTRLIDNARIA